MKKNFICRVCLLEKPRDLMRRSLKNRRIPHCNDCKGVYRCIHCDLVKPSNKFKTGSKISKIKFEDGEKMRASVCYKCDYRLNKDTYARYDKRVQSDESIKSMMLSNMQNWKSSTHALNQVFDLTYEFLQQLWDKQLGLCFYTGQPISLKRGRKEWQSASLDRLNPQRGYIKGNVVWTTRLANSSKFNRTFEEFINFCRQVASRFEDFTPIN